MESGIIVDWIVDGIIKLIGDFGVETEAAVGATSIEGVGASFKNLVGNFGVETKVTVGASYNNGVGASYKKLGETLPMLVGPHHCISFPFLPLPFPLDNLVDTSARNCSNLPSVI